MRPAPIRSVFVHVPLALSAFVLGACRGASARESPASAPPAVQAPAELALSAAECGGVKPLHKFGTLYLGGQPSQADLELLRDAGVRTVISLRFPSEVTAFDERARVEQLGMRFVNEPWSSVEQLDDAVFDKYRALLGGAREPTFVHCASANRVGPLWIAWRALDGGVELEQAVAEARQIGLRATGLEQKARDYVARHAR